MLFYYIFTRIYSQHHYYTPFRTENQEDLCDFEKIF